MYIPRIIHHNFVIAYAVYKDFDGVSSNSELFVKKGDIVGVIEGTDERIPDGFLKVRSQR